jgi:hypothetical protein
MGLKIDNSAGAWGIRAFGHWAGIYGEGDQAGVEGRSKINGGVEGRSESGPGVEGSSESGAGVEGFSDTGDGVYGLSYHEHGVYGETLGDWGWRSGVYGEAGKDHANGVTGRNTAAGPGVYGWSTDGFGVHAAGKDEANFPLHRKGDLVLAGTYGDLFAPGFLRLISDSSARVWLDANNDGGDGFYIYNGAGQHIMLVDESGNLWIAGTLTEGTAGLQNDHPQDPDDRPLPHSSVKSPDMRNVYDGVVVLDAEGTAWVELPARFEELDREFRYQLTPVGGPAPDLHIEQEVQGSRFKIAGGEPGLKVSWQLTGTRHETLTEAHSIEVEEGEPQW